MHILLLVAYGILNCVRGRGLLSKPVCYALFGVLAVLTAWVSAMAGDSVVWIVLWLIAFGGSYYGFAHCWGKYFPDLTDTSAQTCVPLVDRITNKLYVTYTATTPPEQVLNWKTIAMSWRWMIFFAPKYALMAAFRVYLGASSSSMMNGFMVCILLLATVGIIYRVCFTICAGNPQWQQYNVASSEVVTGFCVIGVCDWVLL